MSAILGGLAGYGGMGAGETEEERKRREIAALFDPLAGVNTNPDPKMVPPGERYRASAPEPDLRALVSLAAAEPAEVARPRELARLLPILDERAPTEADRVANVRFGQSPITAREDIPGVRRQPVGLVGAPEPVVGGPLAGLGPDSGEMRQRLEGGMASEYGTGQVGAPRLRDITTPTEEADLAPGPGKRSKWGAFGDVLKGILYGLQTGQGAIAGGLYGGSGQGRRDAQKADRMERIGEITRVRGEQDAETDRQWKQEIQAAEVALRQAQTEDERASAWRHYNQVREAKPGQIHGFDQPMLTMFDPNNFGVRQIPNQGYAGPRPTNVQTQWGVAPDGSGPIQYEQRDGKWVPSEADGQYIRKPMTGEERGPTAAELGQRSADWAGGQEGQKRQAQINELAQYEALSPIDHRFAVSGADYEGIIGEIEAEAAQPPSVDKTQDPAEWSRQKAKQEAAALKLVRIQKARAAAQKIAADRWETERKAAGGGGGGGRKGTFSGVSGWSSGQ